MPRAGLTPDVIVDDAAAIADADGLGAVTLAAIAARHGVAVPSLYKHIGGLPDLHRRLAIRAVEEFGEALAVAVEDGTGRAALARMAAAYRRYALEHPGRYAASVRAPDPDDADHLAATSAVLRTVLALLEAGYGLHGEDAIDAARTLRSALHGFVALEAAGGFGLPRDIDRSYERLVDALDTALASWHGAAS